jgi:predicted DNA-binding transcriptional regulator AlpA
MADNKAIDHVRTLRETAALLSIHEKTLRRLIKRGEGPPVVRLSPNRVGIRDSDREAYIAARVAN